MNSFMYVIIGNTNASNSRLKGGKNMSADKADNRPIKPDKTQWSWLGVVVVLIVVVIVWQIAM